MSERAVLERTSRESARFAYLGKSIAVAKVLNRFKMFLDTTDVGITPHLLLDGFWESWVTVAMMHLVRPGMTVVNVGANMGYYALLFADLVGSRGSVVAVEPNPYLCDLLDRSTGVNGYDQLSVLCAAASDYAGTGTLVIPDRLCGNGHLIDIVGPSGEKIETHLLVLDSILPGARVDLVFIDAEGAEEKIWDGMSVTCALPNIVIVIEFTPRLYKDAPGLVRKFLLAGFGLETIDGEGRLVPTTTEEICAAGNFIMVVLRGAAK